MPMLYQVSNALLSLFQVLRGRFLANEMQTELRTLEEITTQTLQRVRPTVLLPAQCFTKIAEVQGKITITVYLTAENRIAIYGTTVWFSIVSLWHHKVKHHILFRVNNVNFLLLYT